MSTPRNRLLKPRFPKGSDKAKKASHVEVLNGGSGDVMLVLTQAYCPLGHELIAPDNPTFDGYPSLAVRLSVGDRSGITFLSPFHGDTRKAGFTDFNPGESCVLSCPVCNAEFPLLGRCSCSRDGRFYGLYLSTRLGDRNIAGVCSVWGCPRSRLMDDLEVVSEIVLGDAVNDK
jgi:hypothetical protein